MFVAATRNNSSQSDMEVTEPPGNESARLETRRTPTAAAANADILSTIQMGFQSIRNEMQELKVENVTLKKQMLELKQGSQSSNSQVLDLLSVPTPTLASPIMAHQDENAVHSDSQAKEPQSQLQTQMQQQLQQQQHPEVQVQQQQELQMNSQKLLQPQTQHQMQAQQQQQMQVQQQLLTAQQQQQLLAAAAQQQQQHLMAQQQVQPQLQQLLQQQQLPQQLLTQLPPQLLAQLQPFLQQQQQQQQPQPQLQPQAQQQPQQPVDHGLFRKILGLLDVVEEMIQHHYQFQTNNLLTDFNYIKSNIDQMTLSHTLLDDKAALMYKLERHENQLQFMIEEITNRSALQKYVSLGAWYLGRDYNLDHFLRTEPGKKLFLFTFSWDSVQENAELWGLFEDLLEYTRSDGAELSMCVLADASEDTSRRHQERDCIKTYLNGECICQDLLAETKEVRKYCTAFAVKYDATKPKPEKKIHFEAQCPLSLKTKGGCPKRNGSWFCSKCMMQLEYGFDEHLYCDCGAGKVENFSFRCNSESHGLLYEFHDKKNIPALLGNLRSFNGLTILILGETGVGKSTFINGFANYMQYRTLEEAKSADSVLSPVKSTFVVTDENLKRTTVTTGTEDNECQAVGQSATQGTKAHVFNYMGSTNVRLIDTPGIGDTRGIEQDKENFQNILSYISYFDEIHGICILLKPNNSRLTVMFEICIKELLIHLHKNAAENIIFCFTNARNTQYRPGDTFPALQGLLDANKDVHIALKKETVFCMDNESFRYLASVKHGIEYSEEDDKTYGTSWERARGETNRMMTYISGLKGHKVKDTISVNDVRRKILEMTKPLAEIAKTIHTTISTIEDQKEEIKNTTASADEFYKKIHIQVPTVERVDLPYPRTVCSSLDCSEAHTLNGEELRKFKIYCHEHCYLSGVNLGTINDPGLKSCAAMFGSGGNEACRHCGCMWDVHMHVKYELVTSVTQTVQEEDKSAEQRYKTETDRIKAKSEDLAKCEITVQELKSEKEEIIRSLAQFGMFLKENSVIPYNDALIGYLNLQIKVETDKVALTGNSSKVDTLNALKLRYEEEINCIKSATSANSAAGSAMDQDAVMKNLFKLKHYGKNMERLLQQNEEVQTKVAYEESRYEIKSGVVQGFKSKCASVLHFVSALLVGSRGSSRKTPAALEMGRRGSRAASSRRSYEPLDRNNPKAYSYCDAPGGGGGNRSGGGGNREGRKQQQQQQYYGGGGGPGGGGGGGGGQRDQREEWRGPR